LALRPWLVRWIEPDSDPKQSLDSLPGVMWHLPDAWRRRGQPNVLLVHRDDLLTDLDAEMRRIAMWLGIEVDPIGGHHWSRPQPSPTCGDGPTN
jgi:hypothetical protein